MTNQYIIIPKNIKPNKSVRHTLMKVWNHHKFAILDLVKMMDEFPQEVNGERSTRYDDVKQSRKIELEKTRYGKR